MNVKQYKNEANQLHRENAPAYILYNHKGIVVQEQWALNDVLHRLDGPAFIDYDDTGAVIEKQWWVHGQRHRVDGPAEIKYKNNKITREQWWLHGQRHRETGPALLNIMTTAPSSCSSGGIRTCNIASMLRQC